MAWIEAAWIWHGASVMAVFFSVAAAAAGADGALVVVFGVADSWIAVFVAGSAAFLNTCLLLCQEVSICHVTASHYRLDFLDSNWLEQLFFCQLFQREPCLRMPVC